jgi:hypothetical protein
MNKNGRDGARAESAALPAVAPASHKAERDATAPKARDLPPLGVSRALGGWSGALLALGLLLLLGMFGGLVLVFLAYSWTVALMILVACLLAGVPVAVAVVWIVRRSVAESFVRGITSTPLVAILPPPRPAALASPGALLRTLGLVPALAVVIVLACAVAGVDVWAATTANDALRIGSLAVTCVGLTALGVLVLTLGGTVAGLGRAIAARERDVGARFYALAVPVEPGGGQGGALTAVCAVPEPM